MEEESVCDEKQCHHERLCRNEHADNFRPALLEQELESQVLFFVTLQLCLVFCDYLTETRCAVRTEDGEVELVNDPHDWLKILVERILNLVERNWLRCLSWHQSVLLILRRNPGGFSGV